MKKQLNLLISALLILLVACTADDGEPAPEADSASSPTVPALNTLPPDQPKEELDPTAEPEAFPTPAVQTPDPDSSNDPTTIEGGDTGSASPAEVDLSQVTSEPPDNIEPQEAPRPGVPDPQAEIAHIVSQDLARRLVLDVSEVITVGVEDVEWSDSSLGCPASGMNYAAVITPGYEISLEAAGRPYTYHTDLQRNYVLCGDDGQPAAP